MSASAPGIAVPVADIFKNEIRMARELGYGIQTHVSAAAAVVRLVPKTQKTKRIAAASSGAAIESVVPYDMPQHRLDAVHAALVAVLQLARDSA